MKKIFTLDLDGLTMIPSEEAAQMIGGGGGGGSNGTQPSPTLPPTTGWTVTPFWFGEHDERGRNTGYRSLERELKNRHVS